MAEKTGKHTAARAAYPLARSLAQLLLCWALCCGLFVALNTLVCLVPQGVLAAGYDESAAILLAEGDYPKTTVSFSGKERTLDNFTSALSLNIAWHAHEGNAFSSGLSGNYYASWSGQVQRLVEGRDEPSNYYYPQYWHGYLAVLVPMLAVFNIAQMRSIALAAMALLTAYVVARASAKGGLQTGLSFAACLLAVDAWLAAISTSLGFCFVVALAACAFVAYRADDASPVLGDELNWPLFFFVTGAVTVYVDFLDTPVVSLGLPLALYFACKRRAVREGSWAGLVRFGLGCGSAWFAGYGLLMLSKWALALAFTAPDAADRISEAFLFRMGSEGAQGEAIGRLAVFGRNLSELLEPWMLKAGALLLAAWLALALLRRRPRWAKEAFAFLACGSLSFIWYAFLPNHAWIHAFFTYRTLAVALFGLLLALSSAIDWPQPGKRHEAR